MLLAIQYLHNVKQKCHAISLFLYVVSQSMSKSNLGKTAYFTAFEILQRPVPHHS